MRSQNFMWFMPSLLVSRHSSVVILWSSHDSYWNKKAKKVKPMLEDYERSYLSDNVFFFLANVLSMPMTTMAQATSMPPITMPWCARKHSPKSHICNLPQSRKLGQFGGMCVEAARLATHPNISISCPPTICVDVGVWLCSAFRQTSTRCWAGR